MISTTIPNREIFVKNYFSLDNCCWNVYRVNMQRRFDTQMMIRLAESHPALGLKTEMIRKWKRGQSLPNLKTVLRVINHHNLSPDKLFPEVPYVPNDESGTGSEE